MRTNKDDIGETLSLKLRSAVFHKTANFRWYRETEHHAPVLQQASISETGEVLWDPVPCVTGDEEDGT